jgi:hypothetical protein
LPNNPNLFGHHTVSLRAQFAPEGAEISVARITLLAGRDQVALPAVLVPEGASAPGYPYEHIAQAMFTPDKDDIANPIRIGPQLPAEALTGMQRDTPMPGNNSLPRPRQFAAASASAPQFGAPDTSDSNSASTAPTPRRSVRSAQVNSSTAAPNPHLDTSRDAIDAAVRSLNAPIGSDTDDGDSFHVGVTR